MFNPAAWCLENRVSATLIFILIAASGLWTWATIPKQENPEFTIRTATVVTYFPGASPKRVEHLITDKLEERIREMSEIKHIESQSMANVSVLTVEFKEHIQDMLPIWQRLRNKINDAEQDLPREAQKPIVNDEYGKVYGILVAVTGDGAPLSDIKDRAEFLRDEIKKLTHTGKVELWGQQEQRVFVQFPNAGFAEYDLSPLSLVRAISKQNAVTPSGHVLIGPEYLNIETSGEFSGISDIKDISLHLPGRSSALPLDQLAEVRRGYQDPPQKIARFDSKRAVFVAVNMARGGNILEFGEKVRETVDRVREKTPLEISYRIAAFQPEYVLDSIENFSINLIEAFVFVVLVMFLMAGLRVGVAAGLLIPMAVLTCISLLPVFNTALQTMSIASLILALGILVDNGVVVSEDILVRINRGQEKKTAAKNAANRLRLPLLAASLTTISVFLPIPLAPSSTGEYTTSLAIVVGTTLLASWVYCQTLVPLVCSRILKKRPPRGKRSGKLYRGYAHILVYVLKHRTVFLVLIIILTGTALWGFKFVPRLFFPPNERDQFTIDFWQPYGTDIRVTEKRAARLEKFLLNQPETVSVSSFIGTGGPRWYLPLNIEEANTSYASLVIKTKSRDKVGPLLTKCKKELEKHFPDTRYTLKRLMYGPPTGTPIQIRISGENIRKLYSIRDRVSSLLKDTSGVISVWDDWGEWTKKLILDLNQDKARRIGLSTQEVARSVQLQMGGVIASNLRVGDESIPIVVRSKERFRTSAGKIGGLNVYPKDRGHAVPLLQVADPELTWQPSNIRRRDQTRTITVKADISGRFASQVLNDIRPRIREMTADPDWPQGYFIEYGGEFEKSREARASIMQNMPLALGLLILILVLQFNSVAKPLIILLTLPPMMCGITPGMLLTGSPFGFMAMLGLISLLGIIVNNAIILINQIDLEHISGASREESIVTAALKRTRPILMTAITTIMGMIPLSLQGGELWRPMANCIISGLAVATALTLGLCPVLYSVFYRADYRGFKLDLSRADSGSGEKQNRGNYSSRS